MPVSNTTSPKIPNFKIIEECGRGGSSTVWLAVDSDGIRRAIRIMDNSDEENKGRIEMESQAISLYRNIASMHPNLLNILYYGRTGKHLYYVTELADNMANFECKYQPDTLANRIRTQHFTKSEMLDCIDSILNGIEYLHKHHLAHHDLKPENILFIHNELKIADPGLASITTDEAVSHDSGTEGFIPPWKATDKEADIYAIGKIIYCLYTGQSALQFPEIPEGVCIKKIADLNRIALKCCEKDPDARYKSISEIRTDIGKIRTRHTWKEHLLRIRNNAALILGILLFISLVAHAYPFLRPFLYHIPEKEGYRIFLQLQENLSESSLAQTFRIAEKLRQHCPGLASSPGFRRFYTQLEDNMEWLNCYQAEENTVLTMPILLNLAIYPTPEEREAIVQRYILMNPEAAKQPAVLIHYYHFANQNGEKEKASKILDALKEISIKPLNRMAVALAYLDLSNELAWGKNYQEALYFAERAQKLAPQLFASYLMLFQAHYFLREYDKALSDLRKLYKLQPDSVFIESCYSLLIKKGLDVSL